MGSTLFKKDLCAAHHNSLNVKDKVEQIFLIKFLIDTI